MPAATHVTIVGGGLGGLTLARVLHTRGIGATVYELDGSPTARDQGGTLDMHVESGQRALSEAGLFDQFQDLARYEADTARILDSTGAVRFEDQAGNGANSRPELDRSALKRILVDSLPSGTVRWGAKVTDATRTSITLASGERVDTELLVGADGAWSKVRRLLSDATPVYSGMSFVEAHLSDVDTRNPELAALVGLGSMFALGEGKGLLGQRNGDGSIRVYIAVRAAQDWATTVVDPDNPAATRARLLDIFADWAPNLRALIARSDDRLVPRPISALPVGHQWDRVPGVTLIGDAAHLMSPFAGEGANLAMLDATELAIAIAEHDDVEGALSDYETALFPRSEEAALESAENLVQCFEPGAPQGMLDLMAGHAAAASEI
ncbi:MAG TPA: NAD(P)/FAD-dependent oxidoreductase [Pseudonocardiaceae bacterium]|jgi:2-polyprenyl-6-methoxyphenol hydroxylase-like FAD-dependent oxidoreductase